MDNKAWRRGMSSFSRAPPNR